MIFFCGSTAPVNMSRHPPERSASTCVANIIAVDVRHGELKAGLPDQRLGGRRQALRVKTAGVRHDLDALAGNFLQVRTHVHGEEIRAEAGPRIRGLHAPEKPHRAFGEVVKDEVVQRAAREQLRHRERAVDQKRRGAADADDLLLRPLTQHHFLAFRARPASGL